MKAPARFIQLTTKHGTYSEHLYALDEEGVVWRLYRNTDGPDVWRPLSAVREPAVA